MNKGKVIAGRIFIGVMLAVTYLPIIVLIIFSFTGAKTMGVWDGFTLDLYAEVFQSKEIGEALMNSIIIAVASSLLATIIGTFAAIGIYYMRRTPKSLMRNMNQITVINADIVTGIAFMLFFLFINMPDGFPALITSHTVIIIPYVILNVTPRLSQIDPNLFEAGLDLGAKPLRTVFTVMMPQLIGGILSGFILGFALSLDDFVITRFFNGSVTTISTYLYTKMAKKGIDASLRALSAAMFVVILLILLLINVLTKQKNNREKQYNKN